MIFDDTILKIQVKKTIDRERERDSLIFYIIEQNRTQQNVTIEGFIHAAHFFYFILQEN